ncbi:MAG: hypothetical protein IJW59_00115 [Clostridia bacterium]|nr:hypothetical protein [Clostridia bacterium]
MRKNKQKHKLKIDLSIDTKINNIAQEIYLSNLNKSSALFNVNNDYVTLYLIGVPRHGNMGDHAIQTAICSFVKRVIPSVQIKTIDCLSFYKNLNQIEKMVKTIVSM